MEVYSCEFEDGDEEVRFRMVIPSYGTPGKVITNVGGKPEISMIVPDDLSPGDEIILVVPGEKKRNSSKSYGTAATTETATSTSSIISATPTPPTNAESEIFYV